MGNGVFKALTFSDFSTSDDIKLACRKMFSAIPTSGVSYRVRMKLTPSGTTADAYVYCASSNYGFVHIRDHGGTDYYGRVQNGTWTWDSYALKSDSTIVNYKDKITSDFISLYNANSQQACVVRQTNGTKFAIINLAFKLKDGYKSGTEKELMIFPSDLVPSSNVVLQFYADRKLGFAYLNIFTRAVTVTIPIDTSSNSELNLLGYYQIV